LAGHVAEVAALLDTLGIERAHVLGTSFGGEVAVYLAALRPERVASLVAVTAVDRFPEEMHAGFVEHARVCRAAGHGGVGAPRGAPHALPRVPRGGWRVKAASGEIPRRAWGVLALLTLVYLLNFLDRALIYILFAPIKKELQLSDLQLALLGTTSFVIFYTV